MLAIVAAILFAIAFILNAAGEATSAVFDPTSLLLAGLVCLALPLAGCGPGDGGQRACLPILRHPVMSVQIRLMCAIGIGYENISYKLSCPMWCSSTAN